MNQLKVKYNVQNWDTWKELLSKYEGSEVTNKCDFCQFSMSNNINLVCAATYYGKDIEKITEKEKKGCDFKINFSTYVDIGESGIDKEFTAYAKNSF